MDRFSKICALAALLLAAPPAARAALYSEPHCDDLLPEVLNVGLPRVPGMDLGALREAARWRLTELYRPFDVCEGRKRLQVNIAIGNDYQILDWLGQGLIDVAVVPDLSLVLLGRDGVKLLEPPMAADGLQDILAPRAARLRSRGFAGGTWTDRPQPERDFDSFRWRLWCGALGDGAPGAPPDSDRRRCAQLAGGPEYRLALTSHLSTGGFLRPVSETATWLADRLRTAKLDADGKEGRELTDRFWTAFFNHARFTLDGTLAEGPASGKLIEIAADAVPAGASAAPAYRDHLVITARAADAIFNGHQFPRPAVELAPELKAAFERDPAPAAFRSMLAAEPYFGVRTFGFTVEETIGLLRQHQTTSGRARLALVLPGGGVKAVYQSQLVDSLYGTGYLKNVLTDKESLKLPGPRADASPPLDVDFVVGTSGGALLGYFVARLAEGGPWNLSDVLWQNKDEKILDSTDIFGWTDLPRYLSVVAIFLVFSFLLFLASVILRAPIPVEPPAPEDFWRPRLTLAIVPLLLFTPVLIRWVNGRHAQEHIPEIEGLFFAICTCAAVFADQCLVYRREPRPNGKLPIHPVLPLLLGLALVVAPLLPVWGAGEGDRWLDRPVSFLSAFLIFVLLGVGGALILPRRLLQPSPRPFGRRLALAAAELCGVALLTLPLLFLPASLWSKADKLPFFLIGFALVLLVVGSSPRLRQRSERLAVASRRGGYYLGLLTAACLVLLLCRPDDMSPGSVPLIYRESRLNLPGGSLLICLGILSLLAAGILWTYASRHYRLEEVPGFRAGFSLSLLLVVAVYGVLGAVMIVRPNLLSPLELTLGFWKWLLVTSLILGLLVLFIGCAGRGSRWSRRVFRGLSYLCSHHPNSSLVSRRFLRIAVLAIGSFLWWNFVLAPALYGNAHARGFLTTAERRFHREYEHGNPRQDAHRLTAHLLVPANVLERDGTRFFLVVPEQLYTCPPISSRPGSGALWFTYRIEPERKEVGIPLPGCPNFRQRSAEDVEEVIFASGSPFPIFPAHLVELSDKAGKAKWQALVDGGYSNNEPVDAALNVSAEQVLIVESTNPLGPAAAAGSAAASRLSMLMGPLVADLLRLPGFLFERSQQVDRLSRRGLFVVSLSPSRDEANWPPLFDFRRQVVERLRDTARKDLSHRIGLVESWGPPRFQLSVLIGNGYS